nr:RNA-directed DNA polymerase, eukaryota [Tanacetum cinerariifolium]
MVVCLDRHLLDHRPIILCEVQADFGLIPFCFYHSWISLEGFDAMVEQTWMSFSHNDSNKMIRFKKIQDLKVRIRAWIKDKRSSVFCEKDSNSKYFHGLINQKRSQIAIHGVFVDGIWCTNPNKVKEAFFKHFEARFKKPVNHSLKIIFLFSKRLSDVQASDLERRVSRDEIWLAVWNCGENKSPGPDGYSFEFFRKYWNLVVSDLWEWSVDNLKGVGVPSSIVMQVASSIGCGVLHKQFCYLGVMVGECMSRHNSWASTMDKLRSCVSKWKVKTLSIGGRLTLLKAVLGASPLYNMSIFKVPKGILNSMEAIHSKFFNGVEPLTNKITSAAWNKVLASNKNEGLGVSSYHALNRALLLK